MIRIHQCSTRNRFPMNILSLLIKKFQGTGYSHYAISFKNCMDETTYYHSSASGVATLTEAEYDKKYKTYKAYQCTKTIPKTYFDTWFNQHVGKKYGKVQLIGLALKIFNIVKNNPFGRGSKRIICNELVILFLNRFYALGVLDTDSLDLNDTERLIEGLRL